MKKLSSLMLGLALGLTLVPALASYPTGPANSVLRVPSGGGQPKYGAVDLSSSVAVTNQLPTSKGGTGVNSTATFPASGTVIVDGAAQTTMLMTEQGSTPATPSAGSGKFYRKTDGFLYTLDSSGNEKKVGSGGSGGDSGINILADSNPDAETGTGSWTASGGSFTATSTAADVAVGSKSFEWDPSAAQTLKSATVTLPAGVYGSACAAKIRYKTSVNSYTIGVYDGSDALQATLVTLPSSSNYSDGWYFFMCPTSGSLYLKIASAGDVAKINFDSVFLGSNPLVNQVSQASIVGSAYFATTGSCDWSRSSATMGAFSTTSACPSPTVEFNGGPGTIQTTDADLPQVTLNGAPAGMYKVTVLGTAYQANAADDICFAINDGTTTGPAHCGKTGFATSGGKLQFTATGLFNYTSQGNRTFALYGKNEAAAAVTVVNGSNSAVTRFVIERFPMSSDAAVNIANSGPAFAYATHDATCSWSTTSTTYANPSDDASCAFTLNSSKNLTLSSVGSVSPAITWTPDRLRDYEICADIGLNNNGTLTGATSYQLVDGSNTSILGSKGAYLDAAGNSGGMGHTCGIITASSISALTVKVQLATNNGANAARLQGVNYGITGLPAIQWRVKALDTYMGAPILSNGLATTSGTQKPRLESAHVANSCGSSPCTILSQIGTGITSITRDGTGDYNINFAGGTWSTAPICNITTVGSNNRVAVVASKSTTLVEFSVVVGHTNSVADAGFDINCWSVQ